MNTRAIFFILSLAIFAGASCLTPQQKLQNAIDTGDVELARSALDKADVNARNRFGGNALHGAVGNKDREMVRLLLDAGANPDARNQSGYPPLSVVNDLDIARMLLEAGATACRVELLQKIIVHDRSNVLISRAEKAELRKIIHLVQWRRRRC